MNLITTPWLPFVAADGGHLAETPAGVLDPSTNHPALALDFPRPDWNAAVLELLIGLTAAAFAPTDQAAWLERWRTPPSRNELEERLSRFAFAFELDGDGPRAFQDLDPLADAETAGVSQLLIDAPGANTLKKNADLFVKRDGTPSLGLPQAAAALVTLQTYAPAGGAGHRTSMRGGGPLTTLVRPAAPDEPAPSLWRRVWANVPLVREPLPADGAGDWGRVFPWLEQTKASNKKQVVGQDGGHPLLTFFATPRRIRLVIELAEDGSEIVRSYRTKNYGANYEKWIHPLSPYRDDKKAGLLPLHPRAGRATYRDWLGVWGADQKSGEKASPAEVVSLWQGRPGEVGRGICADARLFEVDAFGYAMDKMKAEQWVEARVPHYAFDAGDLGSADEFLETASKLVRGAEEAAERLAHAVMIATFGLWSEKDQRFALPDSVTKAAAAHLGERFWRETEEAFRDCLEALYGALNVGGLPDGSDRDLCRAWREAIKSAALRIYDGAVGDAGDHAEDLKRVVLARGRLAAAFSDQGTKKSASVTDALGLPVKSYKEHKEEGASA